MTDLYLWITPAYQDKSQICISPLRSLYLRPYISITTLLLNNWDSVNEGHVSIPLEVSSCSYSKLTVMELHQITKGNSRVFELYTVSQSNNTLCGSISANGVSPIQKIPIAICPRQEHYNRRIDSSNLKREKDKIGVSLKAVVSFPWYLW